MTPETEVIACPACKHLLRVPLDWLGTEVRCPECKALFLAPVRENGALSEPVLLARANQQLGGAPARRKADLMLMLPAFGLLLCGFAGFVINAILAYLMFTDPAGATGWARNQMPALRQAGFGTDGTPEEKAAEDERNAAQLAAVYRVLIPVALVLSAITLAGGLATMLRRGYRLAQIGCVAAALNVAHGCCVPGALFGLWGLLMLGSEEGREHFAR
ncbi:MAG: hypothetical protein FJ304_15530 [Planctomycetes bacterium]|nr:hypothetical protein [Planctomycetota bacterium]